MTTHAEHNVEVLAQVSIPRQSRGLYDVSRSKRLGQTANAV